MIKANVVSIGKDALNEEDQIIILFGEKVSDRLKDISVIQKINQASDYKITDDMHVIIDDQEYQIKYVGQLVESNFDSIHHTVLSFEDVPDEPRNNAIYLTPQKLPKIKVGSKILIK